VAIDITFTVDCAHCDGTAAMTLTDMTNPTPDGDIEIDVEMSIGQSTFRCEDCGELTYTGDIETFGGDE
jgi:hypothetical protein